MNHKVRGSLCIKRPVIRLESAEQIVRVKRVGEKKKGDGGQSTETVKVE